MKTRGILLATAFLALVALGFGCYSSVTGGLRPGVPLVKDKVEGRYERPLHEVFEAAKAVIQYNGVLLNEAVLHGQTNLVKTLEGRVGQRRVFIRVEQLEPNLTHITVQARTPAGGRDIDLAHEIEKQTALRLVR
ncbi:MAG: DUF3568 domain-containing protein [Verrucomicrobiae bacterium]|nr:DUF3568 domain-containing protein [Verrucomicrobiae bacterium]MCX7723140.1 DUF3568 domain-containing protein [Verrucomicrobiae bacterium]MDW7979025.1 hypothetical protein [Verrucomicrobiales bacterium]